jgi:hypothetical protein
MRVQVDLITEVRVGQLMMAPADLLTLDRGDPVILDLVVPNILVQVVLLTMALVERGILVQVALRIPDLEELLTMDRAVHVTQVQVAPVIQDLVEQGWIAQLFADKQCIVLSGYDPSPAEG